MRRKAQVDLSFEHLATVFSITAVTAALVVAARLRPGRWTVWACRTLAVLIVVNEAGWWVWLAFNGRYTLDFALPLQLCDVACFVTSIALWTRDRTFCELAWFWGLAGTANGLITPDIGSEHFPQFLYLQYFGTHGGIVAGAFLLVVGLRLEPRRWAVARVYAITLGLLAVDALVDLLTGGDYLYLRHPPGVNNLLDLLGPWPWYVVVAAGLALVIFAILDLPFFLLRHRRPAPAPVH